MARILLDWRFDLLFGSAAIVLAAIYIAGVVRAAEARRPVAGRPHRGAGCSAAGCCCSPRPRVWAGICPAMFSVHMAAHMLLSMLIPILVVLGAPTTLALRALPATGTGKPAGPAGMATGRTAQPLVEVLHPPGGGHRNVRRRVLRAVLFGGIFDAAVSDHGAHVLMNLHFLMSGYLFYWVVIGIDPTPRPVPPLGKIGMVFASIPLHAFLRRGVDGNGGHPRGAVSIARSSCPGRQPFSTINSLGGSIAWAAGRGATGRRHDGVADPMATQRQADCDAPGPGCRA